MSLAAGTLAQPTGALPASARRAGLPERLRVETLDLHRAVEANPFFVRLMTPGLTHAEYRSIVARLYGHHAPAEAAIAAFSAELPPALELSRRLCRATLLLQDLRALGMEPDRIAALPVCAVPVPSRVETAWGWLYVLEGSALGGQLIARHLAATLGLAPSTGIASLVPHGDDAGPLWRRFKALMDEAAGGEGFDDDAVVEGARAAFRSLDHWVRGAD